MIVKSKRRDRDRDPFEVARRRMVAEQLVKKGIADQRVLDAMGRVPRQEFVSKGMECQAYEDRPLQMGLGQTISQPLIVALMTEELLKRPCKKVLEIGTGSGYQAAILAELVEQVYSIERLKELSLRARKVLYKLRYDNIKLRIGDGTLGWPEEAPFDGIIVTAGAPCIPEDLIEQLGDGGRLIIPVGGEELQRLEVVTKRGAGYDKETLTSCRFVKLVGKQGWKGD
ncbi:MAG TPA: protein-L-isoaspartate(D-aspartate) O-methyltransferase [bacterium]|nr:protein-L-isoaspartate(D-aspartate) O-methyltransferase [Myxococcales bacterium]HPW45244.1 protein-L-isoaspartate(D-aspartate) O-methyltransferase [bacterium]HQC50300.1 protein-L-isoaspartate(D-aspartate) O-methyltransferase [bacterium]HQG14009.1 protein-L-isoaspartate(D-aspartate) O-methyltransferase [bacterium]HQH79916.1 protein-L-isoaspartate(D-aspartate) O-methyltransferase [bacterium]